MPAVFTFGGKSFLIHPQQGVSMQHNEDWYDMKVPGIAKLPDGTLVYPYMIEEGGNFTPHMRLVEDDRIEQLSKERIVFDAVEWQRT